MNNLFKKSLALVLFGALAIGSAGCDKADQSSGSVEKTSGSKVKSYVSKVNTEAENPYIEYKGEPHLLIPIQMRLDWIYEDSKGDISFIDENFKNVTDLGFESVIIPIYWSTVETQKDQYDFSRLKLYYSFLEKYDLTVEWIWMGTNSCGSGMNAPEYLKKDTDTYKRVLPSSGDSNSGVWWDFSCKATMEREQKALAAMMKWIAENDKNQRCVMIQVDNEVDQGAGVFQPDQTDSTLDSAGNWWQTKEGHDRYCWVGGQKKNLFKQLSALGDIVHESAYNCVTRVNFSGAGRDAIPELKLDYENLIDTSGVDIIGVDCYTSSWKSLYPYITQVRDNITHIAEANCVCEFGYNVAKVLEMGAGIMFHCHRNDRTDDGMYVRTTRNNQQWTEKENVAENQKFMNMIKKVSSKLAYAVPNDEVLEFNGEHLKGGVDITSTLNNTSIHFTNTTDGMGISFPVSGNEWIVMTNRDNSIFEFDDSVSVEAATFGKYEDGKWKMQNTAAVEGNKVAVSAYQVVKVDMK